MSPAPSAGTRRRRLLAAGLLLAATPLSPAFAGALLLAALSARTALALYRHQRARVLTPASDPQALTVGRDQSGRVVRISEQALLAHTLILGATGSGKTTTLLTLLTQEIDRGHPVVVIDLKGSAQFEQQLRGAAHASGRDFALWTIDGPGHWNPLAHGNPTQCKDKLISTEHFSESHYKRAAERYLQQALIALSATTPDRERSLADVVRLLDPTELAAHSRQLERGQGQQLLRYLTSMTPDQLSAVRGLQSRLALLTESHTGPFLQPATEATIDLPAAMERGDVVLFSLNSSSYGQLASQLGTLVVQDVVSAAGARVSRPGGGRADAAPGATPNARASVPKQVTVAIDEFSALDSDNVIALLARGREAGVGVILATQEQADLKRVARGFLDQVIGLTATKFIHRQDVVESARMASALAGNEPGWETSYRETRDRFGFSSLQASSIRPVDRPLIDADTVARLPIGEALLIEKQPQARVRVVRIDRRSEAGPTTPSTSRPRLPPPWRARRNARAMARDSGGMQR